MMAQMSFLLVFYQPYCYQVDVAGTIIHEVLIPEVLSLKPVTVTIDAADSNGEAEMLLHGAAMKLYSELYELYITHG